MKRIDCIDYFGGEKFSQYGVQGNFLKNLHEGLLAAGLESRMLAYDQSYPGKMIDRLIQDRPDCTVMINGIPLNDQLDSISSDLRIPNISILIDAPFYFLHVMDQPFIIFTCFDRSSTELYRKMGFKRMMFLPHATHMQEPIDSGRERKYDAVMFASAIDPEAARIKWREKLPSSLHKIMDSAVEAILGGAVEQTPLAVVEMMERSKMKGNLDQSTLKAIFHFIELYVRGKDRIELIKSIKSTRLDVFGQGGKGWEALIKQDNVFVHDALNFDDAVGVMRDSKVILNSCPTIKDGAHERVFAGLMSGGVVLSSDSRYLSEQFPLESGVRFYTPGLYGIVDGIVGEMVRDEERRREEAMRGRLLVEKGHTWEVRARQLCVEAGSDVDAMNRGEIDS